MHTHLFKKNLNELHPEEMVNKHANSLDVPFK